MHQRSIIVLPLGFLCVMFFPSSSIVSSSSSPPSSTSCDTTASSCTSRSTAACRYTSASPYSRDPSSTSRSSCCSRSGCWCLRVLKLGRDLAAWRVLDERRVCSEEGGLHILRALASIEVRGTEIRVILRPLEGLGDWGLRIIVNCIVPLYLFTVIGRAHLREVYAKGIHVHAIQKARKAL